MFSLPAQQATPANERALRVRRVERVVTSRRKLGSPKEETKLHREGRFGSQKRKQKCIRLLQSWGGPRTIAPDRPDLGPSMLSG